MSGGDRNVFSHVKEGIEVEKGFEGNVKDIIVSYSLLLMSRRESRATSICASAASSRCSGRPRRYSMSERDHEYVHKPAIHSTNE